VHRKGRSPKSCLALFKMADKISMSQQALPKVGQRYIPHNVTRKNNRNGLHFMTSASLQLGPGNELTCVSKLYFDIRCNNSYISVILILKYRKNERPNKAMVKQWSLNLKLMAYYISPHDHFVYQF